MKKSNHPYTYLIIAWAIIVSLTLLQTLIGIYYDPSFDSGFNVFVFPLVVFSVGIFLLFFWIVPGYRLFTQWNIWVKIIAFALHGILYGLLYLVLLLGVNALIIGQLDWEWYVQTLQDYFLNGFHNTLKSYFFFIAILFAFDYFKNEKKALLAKKNLENELNQVKLETLKAKLQPHFLFNTLHSAVALMDEDKPKAQTSLIHLSDLLRFSMDMQADKLILLAKEIKLLRKYLSIEQARYEDQLDVQWIWEKMDSSFLLPAMILQPIVENSIKHGFKRHEGVLNIIIEIHEGNQQILIKNNGQMLTESLRFGTGLQIVQQRLQQHFEQASFRIFQEEEWVVNQLNFRDE